MMGDMFSEMLNKQNDMLVTHNNNFLKIASNIQQAQDLNDLKETFDKEKNKLFYDKEEITKEKIMKEKISKEVKIELNETKNNDNEKNIELEIIESN